MVLKCRNLVNFFFDGTALTEIYTLSLHDALPIYVQWIKSTFIDLSDASGTFDFDSFGDFLANQPSRFRQNFLTTSTRSEEHTSELQSQSNLVCRLLLEKKKTKIHHIHRQHGSDTC